MGKLWALFDLFRKGAAVSDPALWKGRQLQATFLVPPLAALFSALKAFGFDLGLTDAQIASLAIGLLAVINGVLTITTSDKVGLPAKREPESGSSETGAEWRNPINPDGN